MAISDIINNICLLTGGDTNIHGLAMIYIFETCSEILLTVILWRMALRYWTSSLTFDSTLVEGGAEKEKKKDRENANILKPRKKLKRLPISEQDYNWYKRTYIVVTIVTKLGFEAWSIIDMQRKCPRLGGQ